MQTLIQILGGIITGFFLFYFMGIEQVKPLTYLFDYINSTLFYILTACGIALLFMTVFRKLKAFGLSISATMILLLLILYIALNTGTMGF
ncbi:hypothetical protein DRW41_04925 [Neobacillus piezotolerans]|uniref:Uncharacterized protein n=1 Tax=Neobacillus piezotolerans TaxID=2259171 RepID=A0A3D8GXG9_9BACI|nr:hypothetical protein [Neobacillus piezotolerans]RDU38901.1 hypothetical protein DRW41_04925 [Neobacillus piezotolerans]